MTIPTSEKPPQTPPDGLIYCPDPSVAANYGEPIEVEFMRYLTGDEINDEIATQVAVGYINHHTGEGVEAGATRALIELKCGECALRDLCGVALKLTELSGQVNNEVDDAKEIEELLVGSPKWLMLARIGSLGLSKEEAKKFMYQLQHEPAILAAQLGDYYRITTGDLRAGVTSIRNSDVEKKDIPGVRNLVGVSDGTYRRDELTTDCGNLFTVIDVSEGTPHDSSCLSEGYKEYLLKKLLKQMTEIDDAGRPHIYTNDGTRQSNIGNANLGDDVRVIEIRKPGTKIRVYCGVKRTPDKTTIVILGYQAGGNDNTQDEIINEYRAR